MIKIKDVYKKRIDLDLENISLNFDQGYVHILTGKNAQGKSTIIKLIGGIIQPYSGEVHIDGVHIDTFKKDKTLSYMADTFPYAMKGMIMDMMDHMNEFKNFSTINFKYYLRKFGLKLTYDLKELSEGNKQVVAFCFAMAKNAEVYLLDEPSRYMDETNIQIMQSIIQECMLDDQRTIIIATNSFADFEKYADTLTYIDKGKIVFNADTEIIKYGVRYVKNASLVELLEGESIMWKHQSDGSALIITKRVFGEPVLGFYDLINIMGGVL